MPVEVEALRHITLFTQLGQEELAHVAAMTIERHYERGDLIVLEGDPGGAAATACSSILAPKGSAPAWNVSRAGAWAGSGNCLRHQVLMSP